MPTAPLVTIGISTYNRADSYLAVALDSALAQTYENVEVLVSDNCSTDSTPELVLSRESPRLRYIRQKENIGPNRNFNFCLEQARGDYFLLLHDDDSIDEDMVEACLRAANWRTDLGVIRTGTRVVDGSGRVLSAKQNQCAGLEPDELFFSWFGRETAFYLCSTLYHTERLRQQGGFNSPKNLFQDVTALARLATKHGRVDVEAVKANFRRHDDNKGSSDSALDWAEDSLYLLDLLEHLMPQSAGELRRAGLPYLCRKCYRNADAIPSAFERWKTYYTVYRRFGRSYSPIRYRLEQLRNRAKRGIRHVLVGDWRGARPASPS